MSNSIPPTETLVGTLAAGPAGTRARSRRRWLVPFDTRLAVDLPVEPAAAAATVPEEQYVQVEVVRRPGGEARGRLIEVLGDPESPGVDVEVVLRHHLIPEHFPPEVLAAAAALPADPPAAPGGGWPGREDLRGLTVVTIDGESARDFDDAVSIERRPEGTYRLGVHIADVAHYVTEGSELDREARLRGTSVYYPERVVPMLPEELSNGLCSLRPGVPRLTVSAFLDIDHDGRVVGRRFAETVIRSAWRLTYGEVRRVLEEPRPEDAAAYGAVLPALRDLGELAAVLHESRERRGSLDFDLPEGNVELDTDGVVVGILPAERNVAHRLIEELMIAANEAVAFELVRRGVPALFRVHEPPGRERLEELAEMLRPLGISLGGLGDAGGDLDDLPPAALQQVLRQVAGRPDGPFLTALVLRTLQRAVYSPQCRGHYALASRYYTHFTSPIRRYPDLVVHRQLKALLRGALAGGGAEGGGAAGERVRGVGTGGGAEGGGAADGRGGGGGAGGASEGGGAAGGGGTTGSPGRRGAAGGPGRRGASGAGAPAAGFSAEDLEDLAEHTSFTERRAEQSERDLLQWKKVRFLAGRAGERFSGHITGVQPFGLFVQLDGLYVDGLVPIRTLADDFYIFEPEAHRLVGERGRRIFQLAGAVEVELLGVDLRHRGLDLKIAGMPQPPTTGRPRRQP